MTTSEYISVFKALGNETRFLIFRLLTQKKLCACELLANLNITQPTLSHHMKVLIDAGIVLYEIKGKWTYYELNMNIINEIQDLFKDINLRVNYENVEEIKNVCR